MPRKCAALVGGNYNGEPYSQMVKFPSRIKEEEEWKEWITAVSNPEVVTQAKRNLYLSKAFSFRL